MGVPADGGFLVGEVGGGDGDVVDVVGVEGEGFDEGGAGFALSGWVVEACAVVVEPDEVADESIDLGVGGGDGCESATADIGFDLDVEVCDEAIELAEGFLRVVDVDAGPTDVDEVWG